MGSQLKLWCKDGNGSQALANVEVAKSRPTFGQYFPVHFAERDIRGDLEMMLGTVKSQEEICCYGGT